MPLRNLPTVPYVPLLTVRPAELRALQELPGQDKDLLLPFFFLRPWASAHHLDAALDKIDAAYGNRPLFIDLADEEPVDTSRPVHEHLARLRDPRNGYEEWCEFIALYENFIPSLQLGNPDEFDAQAATLLKFGRGLVVRLPRPTFEAAPAIALRLSEMSTGGTGIHFIVDYGRGFRDLLLQQAAAAQITTRILASAPDSSVSISASSFPDGFVGVEHQDIFERQLFDGVRLELGSDRMVYSDRGSARAERQLGGGGPPAPRIDYARRSRWDFFRAEGDFVRAAAYQELARQVVNSPAWDAKLRLWGTQMIERTALGDPDAIISPVRATSARINIHLHQQLYFDRPGLEYDTDEDWTD